MSFKESYKTVKDFLSEDSWTSWAVSLILAFILVKFVFFPLLSFSLGTAMPLVVVESGSMHHPGSFLGDTFGTQRSFDKWWNEKGNWYTERGISKEETQKWPIRGGLEIGDIVVLYGHNKPEKGDIIIFNANQQHPIIHRIISIKTVGGETLYETKGDNNSGQLIFEKEIPENSLIGKAVFKIPKLGWIKLGFVKLLGF